MPAGSAGSGKTNTLKKEKENYTAAIHQHMCAYNIALIPSLIFFFLFHFGVQFPSKSKTVISLISSLHFDPHLHLGQNVFREDQFLSDISIYIYVTINIV